jgi:hypothetical protein
MPAAEEANTRLGLSHKSDHSIRFDDIRQEDGWFSKVVKPDFQRATCAWDADDCIKFLKSVLRRRIIPSIILWRSSDSGLVYVLDGAHRLSVIRAWMLDDWGDKADDFYKKNESYDEIISASRIVRQAVNEVIGPFQEFVDAYKEWNKIAFDGGTPLHSMSARRAEMARFYSDIIASSRTLHAQWEDGDYSAAEESFLAINRQGVRLDELESLLIEYRNGSLARVIMSIANAGAAGHYWPEPPKSDPLPTALAEKLVTFNLRCGNIHRTMFVPPFDSRVLDVNVPFIVAPGHFRLQQHLIELLPLLTEGEAVGSEKLPALLSKDYKGNAQEVIINADILLTTIEKKLDHLGGRSSASLSLALVPLIYWYNRKGSFVRALMYGWMHWMLSGTDADVQARKIAFSSVRGELENVLARYKDEFAEIQHRAGAGLKSLSKISTFIQDLVSLLVDTRSTDSAVLDDKLRSLFGAKATASGGAGKSRSFTKAGRAEINVRELLRASVTCEICGGVVDLKQGVQYDHKELYAAGGLSIPENGRPTHPFCNLFRDRITNLRSGKETIALPMLMNTTAEGTAFVQLLLFDAFPGE